MATSGEITAYEPPRRFAYEEAGWMPDGEQAAHLTATEFLVQARSGGTCVVRLVMSGFGEGEVWDKAIESFTLGWNQALRSLRLYLTHFPGEPAASINAGEMVTAGDKDAIWSELVEALGLSPEPTPGQHVGADAPGVPAFAGAVAQTGERMLTVILDEPARGIGFIGAGGPGEHVYVFVRAQLFGAGAAEAADREQKAWKAWFARRAAPARS